MGKDIGKFFIVLGMFLLFTSMVTAASIMGRNAIPEGSTVQVIDDETGMEYTATVLSVGITTPGHCTETDNGFNPKTDGEIFALNPHTQGTRHLYEHTFDNGVIREFMCGDQGTINGQHYNQMAFAFWYHSTPKVA